MVLDGDAGTKLFVVDLKRAFYSIPLSRQSRPYSSFRHNCKTCQNTTHALAKLDHNPGEEVLRRLCEEALKKAESFNAQEIANSLNALKTLDHNPGQNLLRRLCEEALEKAESFTAQGIATTLNALAKLDHNPGEILLRRLCEEALKKAESFTSQNIANTLNAVANLDLLHSAILRIVSYRIVSYCTVSYRIVSYRIVSSRLVSYRIVSYRIVSVSYRIVSYRIVSYHIVSYRIVSYRLVSYRIVSYRIISYRIVSYRIVSYRSVSYRILSYRIVSYRIVSYRIGFETRFPNDKLPGGTMATVAGPVGEETATAKETAKETTGEDWPKEPAQKRQRLQGDTHAHPPAAAAARSSDDEQAIQRLKAFLRIPTISLEGAKCSYAEAVAFLKPLCERAGLQVAVHEFVKGKPVLIASLPGLKPEFPSICLNSHYDVVPALPDKWSRAPFAAEEDATGWIYARGIQDMKSVCLQYLEALLRLRAKQRRFARTIHLTFVPDEEVGGADGMGQLVQSAAFKNLKVGFALDEGLASPGEACKVFYAERAVNWLLIRAEGQTGHASRFIQDNAMGKLIRAINKFLAFRDQEEAKLGHMAAGCKHALASKLGDVTTVNLTALKGGMSTVGADGKERWALNVVPAHAEAGFDIRLPPTVSFTEMEEKIKHFTQEAGVTYEFVVKTEKNPVTSLDPKQNSYWAVFEHTCQRLQLALQPEVFPAATDGRFLRQCGLPVIGFSPMNHTPTLLHDHDERLHANVYLTGIGIYQQLITALADS
eukprot:g2978.t1